MVRDARRVDSANILFRCARHRISTSSSCAARYCSSEHQGLLSIVSSASRWQRVAPERTTRTSKRGLVFSSAPTLGFKTGRCAIAASQPCHEMRGYIELSLVFGMFRVEQVSMFVRTELSKVGVENLFFLLRPSLVIFRLFFSYVATGGRRHDPHPEPHSSLQGRMRVLGEQKVRMSIKNHA